LGAEHEHRVCTFEEAERAIRSHEVAFANDCFCRTPAKEGKAKWPYCGHPTEVCMGFEKEADASFSQKEIARQRALELFEEWKKLGGFFRFMAGERWLCFCCPRGCGFFSDEQGQRRPDPCEKSPYVEATDLDACTLCGQCVEACPYDARRLDEGAMKVDRGLCYGCSAFASKGASIEHWLDCIESKATPTSAGQVGRAGVEIAEAAYRSAKSGQPVTLPL
jgi:ferredoxin